MAEVTGRRVNSVSNSQPLGVSFVNALGLLALGVAMWQAPHLVPEHFPGDACAPNGRALWLKGIGTVLFVLGGISGLVRARCLLFSTRIGEAHAEDALGAESLEPLAVEAVVPGLLGFEAPSFVAAAAGADDGEGVKISARFEEKDKPAEQRIAR